MIKNFSADYILPVSGEPIRNGVVSINEAGEIIGVYENAYGLELQGQTVEYHQGTIVPGFVNSHCHLELSHLHKKISKGAGLIAFIESIIGSKRVVEDDLVQEAMEKADQMMFENGIVAVGDICNTANSKKIKESSALYYHSYIELFGFNPEKVDELFDTGLAVKDEFGSLPTSIVPHAPYSVSKDLFRHLRHFCRDNDNVLTIHNQESDEENKFYRYKSGEFVGFYERMQFDIEFFKPQARDSIQSIVPLLSKKQKVLLVHNTYTSLKDISFVNRLDRNITWCFCPNANLYIENRLPKLDIFVANGLKMSLGTDSLASNDKLCMLSELKTISKHFPSISLDTSIAWATLNGAMHLGIDRKFGSLEVGKRPGLNLITAMDGLNLTEASAVSKLV